MGTSALGDVGPSTYMYSPLQLPRCQRETPNQPASKVLDTNAVQSFHSMEQTTLLPLPLWFRERAHYPCLFVRSRGWPVRLDVLMLSLWYQRRVASAPADPVHKNPRPEEETSVAHSSIDHSQPFDQIASSLTARFASARGLRYQQFSTSASSCSSSSGATKRPPRKSKSCAALRRWRKSQRQKRQRQQLLEQQVLALRQEVDALERNKSLAASRAITFRMNRSAVAVDLLKEYIHHFEHGYDPTDPARASRDERTLSFARAIVHPQVMCREFRGLDSILGQWEKYTKYHSNVQFVLSSVVLVQEEEEVVSIRGVCEMRLQISRDTLKYLYPSLLENGDDELIDKLIGKVYVMPVDTVFHFNRDGKVFAHESKAHLTSGLLDLLKDPFAAIRMVNASLLTEDGHWKTVHEENEVQDTMNELGKMLL